MLELVLQTLIPTQQPTTIDVVEYSQVIFEASPHVRIDPIKYGYELAAILSRTISNHGVGFGKAEPMLPPDFLGYRLRHAEVRVHHRTPYAPL